MKLWNSQQSSENPSRKKTVPGIFLLFLILRNLPFRMSFVMQLTRIRKVDKSINMFTPASLLSDINERGAHWPVSELRYESFRCFGASISDFPNFAQPVLSLVISQTLQRLENQRDKTAKDWVRFQRIMLIFLTVLI